MHDAGPGVPPVIHPKQFSHSPHLDYRGVNSWSLKTLNISLKVIPLLSIATVLQSLSRACVHVCNTLRKPAVWTTQMTCLCLQNRLMSHWRYRWQGNDKNLNLETITGWENNWFPPEFRRRGFF